MEQPTGDAVNGSGDSAANRETVWVDGTGRSWRVDIDDKRIALTNDKNQLELPVATWKRDISITPHGSEFVVRFETFDHTVGFILSAQQAAPILERLGPGAFAAEISEQTKDDSKDQSTQSERILWPQVSPLAIWALILSALAVVPLWGIIPTIGSVALLIQHRKRVRPTASRGHSRMICAAAIGFLVLGTAVSGLALWGMSQYGTLSARSSLFSRVAAPESNWGTVAAGVLVVIFALSVHEAAHAISAWWLGDGYARSLGRVTLNPLSHIDPFGTLVLPVILVLSGGPVFGYARPVPVQVESLPRWRRAHILISIAGPGSNLLLASLSFSFLLGGACLIRMIFPEATLTNLANLDMRIPVTASGFALAPAVGPLLTILRLSLFINLVLALFNMIPIPPLDGSWVLEHLFPKSMGPLYASIRPYGFLIFLGAIYMGMFDKLAVPLYAIVSPALTLVASATGT